MSENNNPDEKLNVLEGEENLLMDHNYDGIHELNHPLPSWWTWSWGACIIFSVLYFAYYVLAGGPTLQDEFEIDMKRVAEIRAIEAAKVSDFSLEEYQTWTRSNKAMELGAVVFEENCVACHEVGGKGDIGPNLTDNHWLNLKDTTPTAYFNFIRDGNEDNGMPAWGETISKDELFAVMTYVISLKGTFVKDGKEAQGEEL